MLISEDKIKECGQYDDTFGRISIFTLLIFLKNHASRNNGFLLLFLIPSLAFSSITHHDLSYLHTTKLFSLTIAYCMPAACQLLLGYEKLQ